MVLIATAWAILKVAASDMEKKIGVVKRSSSKSRSKSSSKGSRRNNSRSRGRKKSD